MKRLLINIAVLLALVAAFWEFGIYRLEPDKQVTTNVVETSNPEQESKQAALEEVRRAEEERHAEEMRKTAEAEQRRKAEEQKRLAAEDERRRQEGARKETVEQDQRRKDEQQRQEVVRKEKAEQEQRRREEQQRQASAKEEQRRKESASAKKSPQKLSRKVESGHSAARPSEERLTRAPGKTVTIRTKVNAHTATQMAMARVHAGDHVTVKIKRVGKADRQLLVGLGPFIRHWMGTFPDGPLAGPRIVAKPVRDLDKFTVSHDLLAMGGGRFNPDTERGAVLYIGTGAIPPPPHIVPYVGKRTGYYEIEIEIRENNRWDIIPESLA
jgi:hypothetical protein